MRTISAAWVVGMVLCMGGAAWAQAPAPQTPPGNAALDAWVGTWNATGTMMGANTTETVTFSWAAGGFVLEGHHTATMTMPDGTSMAVETLSVWYPHADGTVDAVLFDSMGQMVEMSGTSTADTVTLSSALPDGTQLAGTVTRQADGSHHYTQMATMADGTTAPTADMTYTRAE